MNAIQTIHTKYLRPSRTIETICITGSGFSRTVFVYNYEGYSFRGFQSKAALAEFFGKGTESEFHFATEDELDLFLENLS